MGEKEIKLFTVFLQKIDDKIGTDRMDRLLGYIIGTFNKQYDREEERDSIIETITDYLSGGAEYIDEGVEEEKEYEKIRIERNKEKDKVIESMRSIISYYERNK